MRKKKPGNVNVSSIIGKLTRFRGVDIPETVDTGAIGGRRLAFGELELVTGGSSIARGCQVPPARISVLNALYHSATIDKWQFNAAQHWLSDWLRFNRSQPKTSSYGESGGYSDHRKDWPIEILDAEEKYYKACSLMRWDTTRPYTISVVIHNQSVRSLMKQHNKGHESIRDALLVGFDALETIYSAPPRK